MVSTQRCRVRRADEIHVLPTGSRASPSSSIKFKTYEKVTSTTYVARAFWAASPPGDTEFQDGDIVVIYGTPEALEHAEAVLLAG